MLKIFYFKLLFQIIIILRSAFVLISYTSTLRVVFDWFLVVVVHARVISVCLGVFTSELPECTQDLMMDITKSYYQHFLPDSIQK